MKISKKELNEKAIRLLEVKAEIAALEAEADIMNPGFRTKKWLLLSWTAGRIEPERSQLYEKKRIHAR